MVAQMKLRSVIVDPLLIKAWQLCLYGSGAKMFRRTVTIIGPINLTLINTPYIASQLYVKNLATLA